MEAGRLRVGALQDDRVAVLRVHAFSGRCRLSTLCFRRSGRVSLSLGTCTVAVQPITHTHSSMGNTSSHQLYPHG